MAVQVRSLRLLHISTTSHIFALRKLTFCSTWQRPSPTTFHSNPLSIHLQMWIGSMCIQSGLVFLVCSADAINADWMRIRCASNAQCGQACSCVKAMPLSFHIPNFNRRYGLLCLYKVHWIWCIRSRYIVFAELKLHWKLTTTSSYKQQISEPCCFVNLRN